MKSPVLRTVSMTTSCVGLVMMITGCMQARIEESRELATTLGKGERVVILAKPQIEGSGAEDEFMDCVGANLHDGKKLQVHDNDEFVDRMSEGLFTFARAFHPRPVIYRAMDFRSNEFRGLEGGERFEPEEANPMIGYRGCFRYTKEPDLFGLELRAIARVRREFPGLHLMLPFVRWLNQSLGFPPATRR